MFVKVEEVSERIKKYFHTYIDAGLKEISMVDCNAELQRVMDTVSRIGWISVKDKLPVGDVMVLVVVNGEYGNLNFENAVEMGSYGSDGWLLEAFPEIENPAVSCWMELPEAPEM